MSQVFRIIISNDLPEQTSARLTGIVKDLAGVPIPGSAFDTFTATLYLKGAGTIVNAWDDVDILNENGGSIDENGLFTLDFDPEDMPMITANFTKETHAVLLTWTYNDGATTGRAEVLFPVHSLQHVP